MSTVSLCILLLFPVACGGGDSVSDDAARGWRATQIAVIGATTTWHDVVDIDASLDATVDCPDGGTYHAVGSYLDDLAFDVTVELDACGADGVIIDGELSIRTEVAGGVRGGSVSVEQHGGLVWAGAATGACEIDMTADITAEVGVARLLSADVDTEVHGDICGYSADAVVDASVHVD